MLRYPVFMQIKTTQLSISVHRSFFSANSKDFSILLHIIEKFEVLMEIRRKGKTTENN